MHKRKRKSGKAAEMQQVAEVLRPRPDEQPKE